MTESSKQTLIAFIRFICPVLATSLTMQGIAVDADTLYVIIGVLVSIVTFVWAWWKNNNVTKAATEAQDFYWLMKNNQEYKGADDEPVDAADVKDIGAEGTE